MELTKMASSDPGIIQEARLERMRKRVEAASPSTANDPIKPFSIKNFKCQVPISIISQIFRFLDPMDLYLLSYHYCIEIANCASSYFFESTTIVYSGFCFFIDETCEYGIFYIYSWDLEIFKTRIQTFCHNMVLLFPRIDDIMSRYIKFEELEIYLKAIKKLVSFSIRGSERYPRHLNNIINYKGIHAENCLKVVRLFNSIYMENRDSLKKLIFIAAGSFQTRIEDFNRITKVLPSYPKNVLDVSKLKYLDISNNYFIP